VTYSPSLSLLRHAGCTAHLLHFRSSLSSSSRAKLVLYADDTNILVSGKIEEELQTKLSVITKQLERWLLENDLVVNNTKTVAMSFHSSHSKASLKPNIFFFKISRLNTSLK